MAEAKYERIRLSRNDVDTVSAATDYKPSNIQKVKDHVFNNEHVLDRYASLGEEITISQFDPDLQQGLAWQRLSTGQHTQKDITWLKHELAERHHEKTYTAGYTASHK